MFALIIIKLPNTSMYIYLTSKSESEKSIISAECSALTGVTPNSDGIAIREGDFQNDDRRNPLDITRSAYIKICARVLIQASSFPELYKQLELMQIQAEQFRISVERTTKDVHIDSHEIMTEVGARIIGNPNLSNPELTFLVIISKNKIWFGELISKSLNTWNKHSQKLHQYSSALPTRLARAMVNLVANPGETIIDPCCGVGTILIEANSIGIKASGCDINPLMVADSINNLKHFGLSATVIHADARTVKGHFDAFVTDLPYGRNCPIDKDLYSDILANLKNLAPKGALVTGKDISDLIVANGYVIKRVITVKKPSLTRYIYMLYKKDF